MELAAVFDIGGTSVKSAVMNSDGKVIESNVHQTPPQGNNEIFTMLIDQTEEYKQKYPIKGIALSVPGAVDVHTGNVFFAGAVTDLQNKRVKEELKCLKLPIELENDANCAALAEKWKGNAIANNHFVVLTVGTGIGGSIFINNELYRGRQGMAGEFGLMCLQITEKLPLLMETATLSRLGSTWNLIDRVNNRLHQAYTGEEIFDLYQKKNQVITEEVEAFFTALAVGTVNIIHSLAPEKILFGGGVSSQEAFISLLKDKIGLIRPEALELTNIDHCRYFNQSGLLGALHHYHRQRNIV
ncbi:ROK family protein [Metabacillus dongyingensis]|uniref:ROK family protein n=1 Tax=Metabacillus dongyingensis TaxID=2874282 RepID=UPI003B8E74BC